MNVRSLVLCAAAISLGLFVGLLPPVQTGLALVLSIFVVASLIDVRVALGSTLLLAPFKALLETEIPILQSFPLDVGQLLLLWTLVLWLLHAARHRERLIHGTPLYGPLLLFIVLALPSLWNTADPAASLEEIAKWGEILVLIAVVLSLTRHGAQWLVNTVIMAGCVQAVIGIHQFFFDWGADSFRILDGLHFRAFGSFGNPDPFAGFMSLCLCVALGACVQRLDILIHRCNRQTILLFMASLIAVALLALGLLFSWSRGAWVGFAAALMIMLLVFPRRRWTRLVLCGIVIGGVIVALAANLIPASVVARLTDFTAQFTGTDVRGVLVDDANYALIERLAHWQAAWGMATDHPWFGVGLGAYTAAYPTYALMSWPLALGHAHNYYLNVLAETGLVGLIGYMLMLGGLIWHMLRTIVRAGLARPLIVGILGAWIGLSLHNAFDMLYVNNMYLHLGVLLGLVAHYCRTHRDCL